MTPSRGTSISSSAAPRFPFRKARPALFGPSLKPAKRARRPLAPCRRESGFPGFEAYAWWGVFAPVRTAETTVNRFGSDFAACVREERIAAQLTQTQQISLTLSGPQELRSFLRGQMQTWGPVAREHNIKAE